MPIWLLLLSVLLLIEAFTQQVDTGNYSLDVFLEGSCFLLDGPRSGFHMSFNSGEDFTLGFQSNFLLWVSNQVSRKWSVFTVGPRARVHVFKWVSNQDLAFKDCVMHNKSIYLVPFDQKERPSEDVDDYASLLSLAATCKVNVVDFGPPQRHHCIFILYFYECFYEKHTVYLAWGGGGEFLVSCVCVSTASAQCRHNGFLCVQPHPEWEKGKAASCTHHLAITVQFFAPVCVLIGN